jgi:hypothetical protein
VGFEYARFGLGWSDEIGGQRGRSRSRRTETRRLKGVFDCDGKVGMGIQVLYE